MQRFGVEHNLLLFAELFYLLPADRIYDEQVVESVRHSSDKFHVYMIGIVPKIDVKGMSVHSGFLAVNVSVLGVDRVVLFTCPMGARVEYIQDKYYLMHNERALQLPTDNEILAALSFKHKVCDFNVLYVGQSFGKNGSRDAIDRLQKHEKLQEIALRHTDPHYKLYLLLLKLQEPYSYVTMFRPNSQHPELDGERIKQGLNKVESTTDEERITLFEASLIRYFQPKYNLEFKNSFPSTNLKVLADCYEKDFLAVTAEISHQEIPFTIRSEKIAPQFPVFAFHDLHNDAERKLFFFQ